MNIRQSKRKKCTQERERERKNAKEREQLYFIVRFDWCNTSTKRFGVPNRHLRSIESECICLVRFSFIEQWSRSNSSFPLEQQNERRRVIVFSRVCVWSRLKRNHNVNKCRYSKCRTMKENREKGLSRWGLSFVWGRCHSLSVIENHQILMSPCESDMQLGKTSKRSIARQELRVRIHIEFQTTFTSALE